MSNALSRLTSRDYEKSSSDESELDTLTMNAYAVSLIQVSDSFKQRVKEGYKESR